MVTFDCRFVDKCTGEDVMKDFVIVVELISTVDNFVGILNGVSNEISTVIPGGLEEAIVEVKTIEDEMVFVGDIVVVGGVVDGRVVE